VTPLLLLLAGAALLWGLVHLLRVAAIGAAYKAKALCSGLFLSGRTVESLRTDVSDDSYRILRLFRVSVDRHRRTVTGSFFGLRARTAVYRPGLGATLAIGTRPDALEPKALPASAARPDWEHRPLEPVQRAVDRTFSEPDPLKLRRTRAVVVLRDGRILAERYAPGFGEAMPLPGWSMGKSVLNALVGISVKEGRLSLEQKNLLPEWSAPGDARSAITLEDLLRMRSGLEFAEVYKDPLSDVTRMLFASRSAALFAAAKPLRAPPGTLWAYQSGTSNILSRIVRLAAEKAGEDPLLFPRRALFDPLGMRAVPEPDAAGDFVFSSFLYASARDWARFGQLYAQDGVWEGRRLLPEGWVRFSTTPTPQSPEGRYGAHWWLRLSREFGGETEAAGRIPPDAFHAMGHEGQVLSVLPSLKLVAVRLGMSIRVDAWDHAAFLAEVVDALG